MNMRMCVCVTGSEYSMFYISKTNTDRYTEFYAQEHIIVLIFLTFEIKSAFKYGVWIFIDSLLSTSI